MKITKGKSGYLKSQTNKLMLQTGIEFGVVILLLLIGYLKTGTKLNMFTLIAILGCLPASKALVELITIFPYKTIEEAKVVEIEEKAPLLTKIYDMVLTSPEKIMPVEALVISGNTICGYTRKKKVNPEKTAEYIKKKLSENHIDKMTVKIFSDYTAFLSRAEGMNRILEIDGNANQKFENRVCKIILSLSM